MSLRTNVIANYLGQGWRAVMNLAFIPMYVQYLGMESYGLIGIFSILQAWLYLLDLGMKPSLGREMARFTAGKRDSQSIRDILRSFETIAVGIAISIVMSVWLLSDWLATEWLNARALSPGVMSHAISTMGVIAALRLMEDIYVSSLVGLQKQVLENVLTCIVATLRGFGSIAVLHWVSPDIGTFFLWQALVSLLSVVLFSLIVRRLLRSAGGNARFSISALREVFKFAAGLMGINFLAILLMQVDKVLLSRLLTLEMFGYYTLGAVVANALYNLSGPITSAFYPRFTELATRDEIASLRRVYHQGAELVAVLMGSAAIMLVVFGERILMLWSSDAYLAEQVAPLLRVLAFGTLCNGLMWIPYQMQLANGWTSLAVKCNVVAVAILVPSLFFIVPAYGAIGAAWTWVVLNFGYLLFGVHFMHKRILKQEKWKWYVHDVLSPLVAASLTGILCHAVLPADLSGFSELAGLLASAICVLLAASLCAPLVRGALVTSATNAAGILRSK